MARGQGGSLFLPCTTLSFATPCRFIPALSRHECPHHIRLVQLLSRNRRDRTLTRLRLRPTRHVMMRSGHHGRLGIVEPTGYLAAPTVAGKNDHHTHPPP